MVGFLIYAVSLGIVPIYFFAIVFFYEIFFRRETIIKNVKHNDRFYKLILIFCGLCIINAAIHGFQSLPNFILLPLTILMSFGIKRIDLKIFLLFLIVESFIGFYEQYIGVSSFFNIANANEFEDEDMLYYRKATGLSNSSAAFGEKLFVGMFIVEFLKDDFPLWKRASIILILFLGIVTSFNRTVLGVSVLFILVSLFANYKNRIIHSVYARIGLILFLALLVYSLFQFYDSILFQIARGNDTVDISGRSIIWPKFFRFIGDNFLTGNGSCRLLVPYHSGPIHAHNSFMQLLADNGIVLAAFFLFIIFSEIKKHNRLIILSFFLISLTQFVIFWGMSLTDVFFYAFLCNYSMIKLKRKEYELVQNK